ncbi:hypothetical protein BJF83_23520 [Nocardiopsis sp. CNR-923]|nr:hypothetical protein BJF83_23520 [Nocardiopsis sp. CNR-923]
MFLTPMVGPGRIVLLAVVLTVLSHGRSRVLQVREYYADVRAARGPGIAGPLLRLLPTSRSECPITRWWRALSSSHPLPDRRAETIRDPSHLQDTHVLDLFYAGCAAGVGYVGFQHLARATTDAVGAPYTWFVANASGVLFGVLLGFVVCVFVWRSSLRALVRAERRMRASIAASALTAGVLVGQVVGPGSLETSWVYLLALRPGTALLLAVVLWVVFAVILRWILMVSTTWLSASESVWPLWPCAVVSALMFILALTQWFYVLGHMSLMGHGRTVPLSILQLLVLPIIDPTWIVVGCLGSALPLLASLVWGRELPGRNAAVRLCPPWLPVASSAVVLLGLGVTVAWALRWLIERMPLDDAQESDSVLSMVSVLLPLLAVCLGAVLVVTIVFAWTLGGRGARGRVLSATVVTLFITSFLASHAIHMGIAAGTCVRMVGEPGACGSAFEGLGERSFGAVDSGAFVFASLLLVCVPVAWRSHPCEQRSGRDRGRFAQPRDAGTTSSR